MKQSIITFAAVYAVVLGATSCGGSNSNPVIAAPVGTAGYIQIERLARPAVKEATENFADHDTTNRSSPESATTDAKLAASIQTFVSTVAQRDANHVNALVATLIPDEMAVDLSQKGPAGYLAYELKGATAPDKVSTFGGRSLTDDVIDTDLSAIFGKALTAAAGVPDDGKSSPCLTTDNVPSQAAADNITPATFPYVGAPH
ncbi:MAG: hypothetical protein NVSMB64_02340 [Candidatus Velthaea sp.]